MRRTLDAYRLKSIYSINQIFHKCIAKSVLNIFGKFHYSNLISFYKNAVALGAKIQDQISPYVSPLLFFDFFL